jgi:hypothetical protein
LDWEQYRRREYAHWGNSHASESECLFNTRTVKEKSESHFRKGSTRSSRFWRSCDIRPSEKEDYRESSEFAVCIRNSEGKNSTMFDLPANGASGRSTSLV